VVIVAFESQKSKPRIDHVASVLETTEIGKLFDFDETTGLTGQRSSHLISSLQTGCHQRTSNKEYLQDWPTNESERKTSKQRRHTTPFTAQFLEAVRFRTIVVFCRRNDIESRPVSQRMFRGDLSVVIRCNEVCMRR
jgi:hypothetical protein